MADEDLTDPKAAAPAQQATPVAKAKRPWWRIGISLVIIVVLVGALVTIAPIFIARYLLSAELEALGIDHAGVDSLRINPWKGELWIGPVSFGAGPDAPARLGELSLDINLQALFQRHLAIEDLRLRGVDIVVKRTAGNEIELNGIPLSRFADRSAEPDEPAARETTWRIGVDSVELLDSRLLFHPQAERELEVLVEQLALREFWALDADHPGRFTLNGRVNDILLEWSGQARPFADTVTLSIDSGTTQASVPKLTRFTGSWGLDRNDGTYDVALQHEIKFLESGRIDGHTSGEVIINDVHYALGERFELGLKRALVRPDLRYSYDPQQGITLGGDLNADLGAYDVTFGGKTRLAMARAGVKVTELDLALTSGAALRVKFQPTVELDQVEFAGPIEISVGKLLDVVMLLQSLSTTQAISVAETGLSDYAAESVAVPSSKVSIKRVVSQVDTLELTSQAGQVDLTLGANTDLEAVKLSTDRGSLDVASFNSRLQRLALKSGGGTLELAAAGSNAVTGVAMQSEPASLELAELRASIDDAQLQLAAGTIALKMAASSEAKGASTIAYRTDSLPEARVNLGAIRAAVDSASIDARNGAVQWQATGSGTLESLSTDFAGGKQGALKIKNARASDFKANSPLRFAASGITLDGLDLYLKRSLLLTLTGGEQAPGDGGAASRESAPAGTPSRAVRQGDQVLQAQALLNQQGFDAGAEDGLMGRRTEAAIKAYQKSAGLTVDGRVSDALLAALTARREVAAPAQPASPGGLAIQAGLLALTGRPAIRFYDDTVTPPVTVNALLDTVRVRDFNTEKTSKRTDLELKGVVNEFTKVAVDGWVTGINEQANLELKARIDDIQLPALSPYVVKFAGVKIDSGQLDAAAQAKAVDGKLDGAIQVALDDIAFQPRSQQDAEQLKAEWGVSLETAVGLLSDGDGRIALNLPLSGVVTQPSVDYSEAINKAIGNALLAVFPPSMAVSLVSRVIGQSVPTLDPVRFAPGSAALDETAMAYLDELGKLLLERPKLRVRVCGLATASDQKLLAGDRSPAAAETDAPPDAVVPPAGTEPVSSPISAGQDSSAAPADTLAELAMERQRVVRYSLLEREGVDVKRVSACRSLFDPEDTGDPRVEISL